MKKTDLNISLSTFIESAPLLGLSFNNMTLVRNAQDQNIYLPIQNNTSIELKEGKNNNNYYFGCFDFLVYNDDNDKKFNLIEFNGTATAGLFNLPLNIIETVFLELSESVKLIEDEFPVVIIPYFTSLTAHGVPTSKFFYERIVIADYFKQSFFKYYGNGKIIPLKEIMKKKSLDIETPVIIMGHIKDFLDMIEVKNNRMHIFNYPISISIQDNVCSKLARHFKTLITPDSFLALNPIYEFGANKYVTYAMFNKFIENTKYKSIDKPIIFSTAFNREELINNTLNMLQKGYKIVIKPHASAIGKGITFFTQKESIDEVINKIDKSINISQSYQGNNSWIYPYTICEFIDSCTVQNKEKTIYNHKYELRIFVYREQNLLKAFPAIAKVASKPYNPLKDDPYMLLNNITISTERDSSLINEFVLPLCSLETLKSLEVSSEDLEEISKFSVDFVNYVIRNFNPEKDHILNTKNSAFKL